MSSDRLTIEMLDLIEQRHGGHEYWVGPNRRESSVKVYTRELVAAARRGIEAEACRHGFNDCQLGRHAPPASAPASARPLELNKDHEL